MNITMVIKFSDGEKKTVLAKAADIVAFEERFDMSMARLNESTMRLTHMFWLAWHTCKRTNITHDEFEKWLEGVESVETPTQGK